MCNTTTEDTISALSTIFSLEGISDVVVSDNGPQLTSENFKEFCSKLCVVQLTTAPFQPASNGLEERFERILTTICQ